ncbi:MAG: hypothetical protein ACRDNZ_11820 [Streptosporangiaceae bacterium]
MARGAAKNLQEIVAGVRQELEPGEVIQAGCDGRVTSKVEFLGMRVVTERPFVSHFLVVTDRRVLVFWIAPKKFTGGLSTAPALVAQATRDTVCASDFVKKFTSASIRFGFPEGPVPFEVNDNARDILGKIAGLLPLCPPRP